MAHKDPKKFDPARAHVLDSPERERYLPTGALVDLLDLHGGETVVDYGAGTGRLTLPIAQALGDDGRVVAVDSSEEMLGHLHERVDTTAIVEVLHVTDDAVPMSAGSVDRVLAVNLLHEVRGEGAMAEFRRLLADDGFALIVDWERARPRDVGPPDELLYASDEARAALAAVGLDTTPAAIELPFHFALVATPAR